MANDPHQTTSGALPVAEAAVLHAQGRRIGAYRPGTPTQHEKEWLQPQNWSGSRRGTVIAFRETGDDWLVKLDDRLGWCGTGIYEFRLEDSHVYSCKRCGDGIDPGQPDGGADERLCLRCWREDHND